ncbi:hypothetical protein DPX39_110046100 [Trypanosoma brucei equiperdum]|uniref:Uncharacterized protein n=1 Tax=Trypanosoma brucei equiperdum TaxID=630700 RepID=A0A3L6KUI3_9TRYP|nr:hypothetical protein DPX39_110046100 [Trypanosoma brucei equiperdum]
MPCNEQTSRKPKPNQLVDGGQMKVLSAGEQVLVLRHLSRTYRLGVALVRVLAALQLLLAFLYICLIIVGYPLVVVDLDDNMSNTSASPTKPGALSRGGTAAITISAVLLAVAGLSDIRSCRGVLYVHPSLPDIGSHTNNFPRTTQARHVEGNTDSFSDISPRYQFVIALLSLLPTTYWLFTMVSYRWHLAQKGALLFGFVENWRELLIVIWQPVGHTIFGMLLASMVSAKEDLIGLAHMKYE